MQYIYTLAICTNHCFEDNLQAILALHTQLSEGNFPHVPQVLPPLNSIFTADVLLMLCTCILFITPHTTIDSVLLYCSGTPSHDDMHLSLQYGWTPLMKTSEAGHMECVKVLLDKGAEVNMQDKVSGVIVHCVHPALGS